VPNYIPEETVAKLIEATDIILVIGSRVKLASSGKERLGKCPFHKEGQEKHPSFSVNQEKGLYYCFTCKAGGNVIDFLKEYDHKTFREALEEMAKITGLEIPKTKQDKIKIRKKEIIKELNAEVMNHFIMNLRKSKKAIKYLKTRGIDGKTAKQFSIGFANQSWDDIVKKFGTSDTEINKLDKAGLIRKQKSKSGYRDYFRKRIIFPIRDNGGSVLGFAGRAIDDDTVPKYINSPETEIYKKKQLLYGMLESYKSLRSSNEAIIVEGYTDVIALSKAGFRNALASAGTAITDAHIKNVFKFTDTITFCFDGDNPGKKAAQKACEICLINTAVNKKARFLILPQGQDPDELIKSKGPEVFKKLLKKATPLSDFFITTAKGNFNFSQPENVEIAAEKSMETVNKMKDGIYKDKLIEKIAAELGIRMSQLEKLKRQNLRSQSYKTKMTQQKQQIKKVQSKSGPSLVRQAINIIMHYPKLVNEIAEGKEFKHIDDAGINLGINILNEIISLIHSKNSIKAATIVEYFNDENIKKHLKELAVKKLIISEKEANSELREIILRLNERNRRSELKKLVNKAKDDALTASERKKFLRLSKSIEIK
jgi:DNA primase